MSRPNTTRMGILTVLGIGLLFGYIVGCGKTQPSNSVIAGQDQDASADSPDEQKAGPAGPVQSKEATTATRQANAKVQEILPFADKQDFDLATRGFIGCPESLVIKDAEGNVVWDMDSYAFIADNKEAPDSVNPSLWRNAQLCKHAGLYKVMIKFGFLPPVFNSGIL